MSEIEQIKAIVKNAIFNDSLICIDPEEIQKLISTIESSQARIAELEAHEAYNKYLAKFDKQFGEEK